MVVWKPGQFDGSCSGDEEAGEEGDDDDDDADLSEDASVTSDEGQLVAPPAPGFISKRKELQQTVHDYEY